MHLEDSMRPRRRLIGLCRALCPPRISQQHDLFYLLCADGPELRQSDYFDGFFFADLEPATRSWGAWFGEEVSDFFVVDFEKGYHDFDVPFVLAVLNSLEEVGHC